MLDFMTGFMARALGMHATEIDRRKDLQDYGASSLVQMALLRALQTTFGIEIAGRELLRHRTLDALAAHLSSRMAAAEDMPPPAANGESHGDGDLLLESFRSGLLDIATVEQLIDQGAIR
jgi:acyl carrier protein